MSDIDTNGEITGAGGQDRKAQAKAAIGQAGQTLKQEAQTFASAAQDRARAEAQKRAETATKTLGDFANAIRRAGDELASSDQSPAARLIGQAADGRENLSRNLAGKEPEELLDAVRDFGRRHPAAFIGGAVLAGIALGRFVRASHDASDIEGAYPTRFVAGSDDMEVGAAGGLASAPTMAAAGPIEEELDAVLGVQGTDAEVMDIDADVEVTDLDVEVDESGASLDTTGRTPGT